MTYKLTLKNQGDYLAVQATGIRSAENISAMAKEILEECNNAHVDMVLVDVRELQGKISIFDSLMIIVQQFQRLRRPRILRKAVLVDLEERRERSGFFERAARNRSFNLRVFSDMDEARSWLHIGCSVNQKGNKSD